MKNKNILPAYKVILGYSGFCMILVGVAVLATLLTLFAYPEESIYAWNFIIPGFLSIIIGTLLFKPIYKKKKIELDKNHDTLIVLLAWIFAIIICMLPYYMSGKHSITHSIFEATSGLTTTGLTVMQVDELPKIYLMFRSVTLYLGGVGLILIMTSLFSSAFGMRLYNAEGHPNKLIPNVIKSSRMIVCIYTGYILVGAVLYIIFGMTPFDAINHSIAAVANGGFSTHSENIGYYNSIPIEIITMVLMILGGTNFWLNLMLITGKFKRLLKHCETKTALVLWIIFVPILSCILLGGVCETFGEGFRVALFQLISAMATAGFQTVKTFEIWPSAALFLMATFMIIGFQSGSTAGGIKQYRLAIAAKSMYYDIKSRLMNKREVSARKINIYGENTEITKERSFEAHNFIMIYLGIILSITFIYTLCGYSLEKSLFESASILGCVGLSAGITGIAASNFINWVAILGMLIGRLDIYPVVLSLMVLGQDIKKAVTSK